MIRLLQWLRWGRIFASHQPLVPAVGPMWTRDDTTALGAFMATDTGRKLVLLMRYQEQSANASAVLRKDGRDYACGYAGGFRGACAWIYSLSANVAPYSDEDSQQVSEADLLAERSAP